MKLQNIGKVVGALGLVLLLSAPFTYFLTGEVLLAGGKASLGLALILFFLATNYRNLGQFASGRSTFFFTSSIGLAVALLGALAAVNYIATKKDKTWDFTRQQIFTLAPQTRATLGGLKEKVHAIGFMGVSSPYYDALDALFSRYRQEAPDRFDYVFKDPKKSPDLAQKYQLKQGQASVVLTRGEGAREAHTTLSIVSEQELTNALIKLNSVGEQKVYFVQGHGEWALDAPSAEPTSEEAGQSLSEWKRAMLQEGYQPAELPLAGTTEIPRDAAAVVVAGARQKLLPAEVKVLRDFLAQGGRLLVFDDALLEPGKEFEALLADYGVQADPGVIADDRMATGSPYQVVSVFYAEHEITRALKQLQMQTEFPTARGLSVLHAGMLDGVKAEPVVTTSPYAWEESKPTEDPQRSDGEKTGQIPLVVASTRSTAGAASKRFDEARLVVFGESELLPDVNWGQEGNRNLVMNALGWVSNQVSKITIRPPDRDVSTLDLDKHTLARIRFFATDLLPLSLLGIGLAIWLSRRNK